MGKKIKDCKEKNDKNMHLPNWKSAHAHTHTPKWIPNERERKKSQEEKKKLANQSANETKSILPIELTQGVYLVKSVS